MNWSKRSQYEEEINKEEELKKDKVEKVRVNYLINKNYSNNATIKKSIFVSKVKKENLEIETVNCKTWKTLINDHKIKDLQHSLK